MSVEYYLYSEKECEEPFQIFANSAAAAVAFSPLCGTQRWKAAESCRQILRMFVLLDLVYNSSHNKNKKNSFLSLDFEFKIIDLYILLPVYNKKHSVAFSAVLLFFCYLFQRL